MTDHGPTVSDLMLWSSLGKDQECPYSISDPNSRTEKSEFVEAFLVGAGLDRRSWGRAQTVALTTMVILQMFHVGNCRSESRSVFVMSPWSNPFLFLATATAFIIHAAALYLPWTQFILVATRVASRIGAAFGLFLILIGVVNVVRGAFIAGLWQFLIGMFLRGAAQASYQQLLTRPGA
jgi:magnesium-transporting ATPase (P-type)